MPNPLHPPTHSHIHTCPILLYYFHLMVITMVKCLVHKTIIIFLQETHCTCIDKLVITNAEITGSIPSRKHWLATFICESLSWILTGRSPKDSGVGWFYVHIVCLKIITVCKTSSSCLLTISFQFSHTHMNKQVILNALMSSWDIETIHPKESIWCQTRQQAP